MHFGLSDEQWLLQGAIRGFLEENTPLAAFADLLLMAATSACSMPQ